MKTKFIKRVMAVALTSVMTLGLVAMRLPSGMLKAYGANDIAISEDNFDARICTYLSENHDSDSDGYIDDVSSISLIYINDSTTPVASLKGIEKLTSLTSITIKRGTFTEADLTVCPNLTSVSLYMCGNLTSVNVTGLSNLRELLIDDCYNVDTVSGINNLPALNELTIEYGNITELDLTTSPNLTYVSVPGNGLTTLNVAGLSSLVTLRCGYNNLTELDLTGCTAIEELGCACNSWSSTEPLDLTKIPNVKKLNISGPAYVDENSTETQITNITFPEGNKLEEVRVGGNAITNLDVSNCENLLSLYCNDNPIETLTLDNPVLDYIYFGIVHADPDETKAFALDTSKCPALRNIYLSGNYMINAVDFTNNTLLEQADLSSTSIETIDLTKNIALWELDIDETDITSLDLSKNTNLLYLDMSDVNVQNIDLSNNTKLRTLDIGGSALTTLNLENLDDLYDLSANYTYGADEYNVLSSINFSGCSGLKEVELGSIENLHAIDLTDCVALEYLELDLALVLMCKLPSSNTTVEIYERQNSVYLYDVEDTFDLKTIVPNIDETKISNVSGNKDNSTVAINGTELSGYQIYETITYQYDCGNGMYINPELKIQSLAKADNSWTTELSMEGWTYSTDNSTAKSPNAAALYGTPVFTYSDSENGTYTSTKPSQAGTYWVKATVAETDDYYGLEAKTSFVIEKANPTYTAPTSLKALVGQKLLNITLPTATNGVFEWANENLSVGNVGNNTFEVTFTPNDTKNYETVTGIEVEVEVSLNENSWTSELTMEGWTYGEAEKNPSAASTYGTPVYTYSTSENGTYTATKPSTAGTYWVKATVAETDIYEGMESDAVMFVIAKATPEYEVPTGLEALALQKLSDVELPDGFAWETPDVVFDSWGNKTFEATFTPDDTANYKIVENIDIEIYVDRNENGWITTPSIASWTYGEEANVPSATAKYGTVVYTYSNSANGTFTSTVPNGAGTYYVKAEVAESESYTGLESDVVSFVIEKATPEYTVPTGLTAKTGQTLAEIELPEGFTWMDATEVVSMVANTRATSNTSIYLAKFTPADTENYKIVENISVEILVELNENEWTSELTMEGWTYGEEAKTPSITAKYGTPEYVYSDAEDGTFTDTVPSTAGTWYVKAEVSEGDIYTGLESDVVSFVIEKATPEYTLPTDLNAEEGQMLADVKLPEGFVWADEKASVGETGNNKFKAVYTPADIVNYKSVEVELTVTVKAVEVEQDAIYTGDVSTVELWLMVMIVSVIAVVVAAKKRQYNM